VKTEPFHVSIVRLNLLIQLQINSDTRSAGSQMTQSDARIVDLAERRKVTAGAVAALAVAVAVAAATAGAVVPVGRESCTRPSARNADSRLRYLLSRLRGDRFIAGIALHPSDNHAF